MIRELWWVSFEIRFWIVEQDCQKASLLLKDFLDASFVVEDASNFLIALLAQLERREIHSFDKYL